MTVTLSIPKISHRGVLLRASALGIASPLRLPAWVSAGEQPSDAS